MATIARTECGDLPDGGRQEASDNMAENELPDSKQARVDWVIRAPDNSEMRRRYDVWADRYDGDVGSVEDYAAPGHLAEMAHRHLDPNSLVIDAGAGTGLVAAALKPKGFRRMIALDYSERMLAVARGKNLYTDLAQCDLSRQTSFAADFADAVVTCGTTTQVPCESLNEYVRLVRPSGKIIFAAVTGTWQACGYAAVFDRLEKSNRIRLIETGAPFQMMPTTEPDFICEIMVMETL
ncbi:MAG: class I SAM-dependent methyltransferase [Pseudomonadota bacterium]